MAPRNPKPASARCEVSGEKFILRFTGDRSRLRLDFRKGIQEALGLRFGDLVEVSITEGGDLALHRVDERAFADPELRAQVLAQREAQRLEGVKRVAAANLYMQAHLRLNPRREGRSLWLPPVIAKPVSEILHALLYARRNRFPKVPRKKVLLAKSGGATSPRGETAA